MQRCKWTAVYGMESNGLLSDYTATPLFSRSCAYDDDDAVQLIQVSQKSWYGPSFWLYEQDILLLNIQLSNLSRWIFKILEETLMKIDRCQIKLRKIFNEIGTEN